MKFSDLTLASQSSQAPIKQAPAVKKQKKWVPPLQQMLELLKQSVAKPAAKPAANNAILATANDPAMSLTESEDSDELSMCTECGHLHIPSSVDSDKAMRIHKKWDKLSEMITGGTSKCKHH